MPEIHFNYKIVAKHCCTQTGDVFAVSKGYRLTDGNLRGPPIPGSARARSIAAHRRVEELRIMGAGDSPVNEVRKNSGNSTIAFER